MNATTNKDAAKELLDEALAWPIAGPGQSAWQDWMLRAREAINASDGSDYHDLLASLVKAEHEDGLSLAQWASFLCEACQLKEADELRANWDYGVAAPDGHLAP